MVSNYGKAKRLDLCGMLKHAFITKSMLCQQSISIFLDKLWLTPGILGEMAVSAEKLSEDKNLVEWLSSIFGYSFYGIEAQEFVNECRDMLLYHSTPFGDHESGKPKLYLLENSKDKSDSTKYMPVFLTQEHMREFYKDAGRPNYLILTATLKEVLKTLDSSDLLSQLGVVIEPKYCGVSIPMGVRVSKQ